MAAKETKIELPQLAIERVKVKLVGDSPLLTHRWSEKAKKAMLDRQMKTPSQGRAAKDPFLDYCDSLYWISARPKAPTPATVKKGKFGFPAVAFKAAAVDACSHIEGVSKVEARGAFHINFDPSLQRGDEHVEDLVVIQGEPSMREDMVRVGMGTADLRYRAEFKRWRCEFEIRYNKNVLSIEQIVNLFNTAGFAIGVGEWRPQKDGSYGMFHVASKGE